MKSKLCTRCKRKTSFFCLGCHLPFCSGSLPKDAEVREEIPDFMKEKPRVYQVTLGKKRKRIGSGNKIEMKRQRQCVTVDMMLQFRADCHTISHINQIRRTFT